MLELETQNPPPPPPPKHWYIAHPYAASTMAAMFLFLVGSYIVLSKSLAEPPPPSVSAWGGTIGSILNQNDNEYVSNTEASPENILRQVQDSPPYTYKIPPLTPQEPPTDEPAVDRGLDLQAFITALESSQRESDVPMPTWSNVIYEFPPSNIFSGAETSGARSELQQKLYNYGNEVGSYIQSYEQQNKNQTQLIKDQLEDRENPDKAKAVVQIGRGLQNVAANMRGIDEVPEQIASAHEALITSYTEIGYNLTLVPEAKNNQELLSVIGVYNKSAEVFAERFVDMVQVFSKYNVVFSSQDAGSVFTFTYSSDE